MEIGDSSPASPFPEGHEFPSEGNESLTDDQVRTLADYVDQLDFGAPIASESEVGPGESGEPQERSEETSPPDPQPVDMGSPDVTAGVSSSTHEQGGDEEVNGPGEQPIVCQLRSSSLLRVRLRINNRLLRAVVDTAAQVTLVSDRVLKKLDPQPLTIREVTFRNAGRDLTMKGSMVGPVKIQLGQHCFDEDIHVAPIEDDVLLGLDLLRRHQIDVHMKDLVLVMEEQAIPLEFGITPEPDRVAPVTHEYRVMIPPNTLKRITGVIDQRDGMSPSPTLLEQSERL